MLPIRKRTSCRHDWSASLRVNQNQPCSKITPPSFPRLQKDLSTSGPSSRRRPKHSLLSSFTQRKVGSLVWCTPHPTPQKRTSSLTRLAHVDPVVRVRRHEVPVLKSHAYDISCPWNHQRTIYVHYNYETGYPLRKLQARTYQKVALCKLNRPSGATRVRSPRLISSQVVPMRRIQLPCCACRSHR